MRVVLDTNIIVSGLLSGAGPPAKLLRLWLEGRFELITSNPQLDELSRVLAYKKIKERIAPDQASDFLQHIDALAHVLESIPSVDFSPDPDDNAIIATALEGKVDFLVSGDKTDLLSLKKVKSIPILTARRAVNRFKKK